MIYEMIDPPYTPLNFREMSHKEASQYFDWYLEHIPYRTKVLERAVQSTSGYEDWKADYKPESLKRLGQWFYEHIQTRKRTEQEKETIYRNADEWFRDVTIQDWDLTNRTISLAMDIGMYFSQVLENNLAELTWEMVKKPKNDADYQQPVLVGPGKYEYNSANVRLNPDNLLMVYAYSIARENRGPEGLKELYDIWSDLLLTGKPPIQK